MTSIAPEPVREDGAVCHAYSAWARGPDVRARINDATMSGIPMFAHALRNKQVDSGFARGAADWLCLAAAPTFAVMALLAAAPGAPADMLCSAAQPASPLGGMAPMYWLMSAFHAAPWLRWISSRRTGIDGSAR